MAGIVEGETHSMVPSTRRRLNWNIHYQTSDTDATRAKEGDYWTRWYNLGEEELQKEEEYRPTNILSHIED
eukprot:4134084-Ditylum_brightwellii.AAC.1